MRVGAPFEANRNADIHAVPIKPLDVQAIASWHRLRSTWVRTRTARLNTTRGLLRECGIFIPVGASRVVPRVRDLLAEQPSAVPDLLHAPLTIACGEIRRLEDDIHAIERQLDGVGRQLATVPLLQTIPGIGVRTATALAAVANKLARIAWAVWSTQRPCTAACPVVDGDGTND